MKKIVILIIVFMTIFSRPVSAAERFFEIQAIDTMKYSRDKAREMLHDPLAGAAIDRQISAIAKTGATHVAIATPYDEEFFPILSLWVASARSHKLNVWFRGNFSGWEEWFDHPRIMREEHKDLMIKFLLKHNDLFQTGDIFVPCPECENGGPGDPRKTHDIAGFRQFMIEERLLADEIFSRNGKQVYSGFASMNGDVARLIMDKKTTSEMGGFVTVDHYVQSSNKLISDVVDFARQSLGRVVLGEWGAPIPDIHGQMTEDEQARWISDTLALAVKTPVLFALNYWTFADSSTSLWNPDGSPRKAAAVLTQYYSPYVISGRITDTRQKPLENVEVRSRYRTVFTDKNGMYQIPVLADEKVTATKSEYEVKSFQADTEKNERKQNRSMTLEKSEGFFFWLMKLTSFFKKKS